MKPSPVTVLILAGGRGRRMGGADKAWLEIDAKPLVKHLYDTLIAQGAPLFISANRNLARYTAMQATVVPDIEFADCGPLAGLYNALTLCQTRWLLTVAVDTPRIPEDYVARFLRARNADTRIYVAHDGTRAHPTCAMIHRDLTHSLGEFLAQGGRQVTQWQQAFAPGLVDFSDCPQACFNINTPDDLRHAAEVFGS
ncbi:MAG: molybdenum cofactor guanylyltransferase [Gammaproteobacteria bacterium]|nr:molybdenum cofactor guanylyltransferase [Gammaproteobacteria bacterium]